MCGILGYFSTTLNIEISKFSSMLYKLNHRGQDSCGISFLNNTQKFESIKKNNFNNLDDVIKRLYYSGSTLNILGHVQYITSSKNAPITQPCYSKNAFGYYSFVFNGNIPTHLYKKYNHYSSDTQLILDFFNTNSIHHDEWYTLLEQFMTTFERSYSLIIQTKYGFYIMRDRYGVRPLFYLKKPKNTYIFTSEVCIFTSEELSKNKLTEVKAGEIISLKNGIIVKSNMKQSREAHCLFEYIYFLKKESIFENIHATNYRYHIGEKMGMLDIDFCDRQSVKPIVVGVPNTGNDYALSYANTCELEYKNYITKNKNIGRTFILKNNKERTMHAERKYIFDERMKGTDIILVDDSLVRGITMLILIKHLLEFGVGEIHIRIMSPPVISPCLYGIDIPTKDELIYNSYSGEKELSAHLGCTSLKYLNLEHHKNVVPDYEKKCVDCFSPKPKYNW
jgi:amidophosphoribosyltransferase